MVKNTCKYIAYLKYRQSNSYCFRNYNCEYYKNKLEKNIVKKKNLEKKILCKSTPLTVSYLFLFLLCLAQR